MAGGIRTKTAAAAAYNIYIHYVVFFAISRVGRRDGETRVCAQSCNIIVVAAAATVVPLTAVAHFHIYIIISRFVSLPQRPPPPPSLTSSSSPQAAPRVLFIATAHRAAPPCPARFTRVFTHDRGTAAASGGVWRSGCARQQKDPRYTILYNYTNIISIIYSVYNIVVLLYVVHGYYGSSHYTQTAVSRVYTNDIHWISVGVSGASSPRCVWCRDRAYIRTTTIICFMRQRAAAVSVNTRRNRLPAPPWRRRLGKIFFVLLFFPRERERERETIVEDDSAAESITTRTDIAVAGI